MFYRVSNQLSPWLLGLSVAVMIYGSWMGLFQTPPDYQQGDAYRIMYIHVPFALYSLMIYLVLSVSALIYLVW